MASCRPCRDLYSAEGRNKNALGFAKSSIVRDPELAEYDDLRRSFQIAPYGSYRLVSF